jgi:hypothetical protein
VFSTSFFFLAREADDIQSLALLYDVPNDTVQQQGGLKDEIPRKAVMPALSAATAWFG